MWLTRLAASSPRSSATARIVPLLLETPHPKIPGCRSPRRPKNNILTVNYGFTYYKEKGICNRFHNPNDPEKLPERRKGISNPFSMFLDPNKPIGRHLVTTETSFLANEVFKRLLAGKISPLGGIARLVTDSPLANQRFTISPLSSLQR